MPEASKEDMRWVLDRRHGRVLIMDDIYSPSVHRVGPISRDRKHVEVPDYYPIISLRSLLVRDALYFTFSDWGTTPSIIMYDLSSNGLSMIDASRLPIAIGAIAMKAHDGGLGYVATEWDCLYLILMSQQAAGGWAQHKTVEFEPTLLAKNHVNYTIFISTDAGVFTLHLKSRLVKKVAAKRYDCYRVLPYTSFFKP
ncbi:LOW QUALITY PROTEIN: hypothetical protein U9M48_043792, partial [Paspalum notatum var. saurae]